MGSVAYAALFAASQSMTCWTSFAICLLRSYLEFFLNMTSYFVICSLYSLIRRDRDSSRKKGSYAPRSSSFSCNRATLLCYIK